MKKNTITMNAIAIYTYNDNRCAWLAYDSLEFLEKVLHEACARNCTASLDRNILTITYDSRCEYPNLIGVVSQKFAIGFDDLAVGCYQHWERRSQIVTNITNARVRSMVRRLNALRFE
jgi:hypothetical protein